MILILLCSCSIQSGLATRARPPGLMAITVDDIPRHGSAAAWRDAAGDQPAASSPRSRPRGVPAFGFVNGGACRADAGPCRGRSGLWSGRLSGRQSHLVPRRSRRPSRRSSTGREIARNEPLLERLSHGRDWRWFRFPYLAEGNDPGKRATIRKYLAEARLSHRRGDHRLQRLRLQRPVHALRGEGRRQGDRRTRDRVPRGRTRRGSRLPGDGEGAFGTDMPQVLLTHVGASTPACSPGCSTTTARWVSLRHPSDQRRIIRTTPRTTIPAFRGAGGASRPSVRAKGLKPPPKRTPNLDLDTLCR